MTFYDIYGAQVCVPLSYKVNLDLLTYTWLLRYWIWNGFHWRK